MVAKATSIVATGVDCARDIVKDLSQRQFFRITLTTEMLENS